ncbi:MAG: oligosaccharide flippase family protein [bacterium]
MLKKILKKDSIIKDIVGYIPSKIVPALVGILTVSIYTRLLTPEDYGLYSLVTTTVSIITSIIFGWINNSGMRYYQMYKEEGNEESFLSTSFWAIILLFLIVLLVFFAFFSLFENELLSLLKIGIFIVLVQELYKFFIIIIRARRNSLKYSIYSSALSIFKLILATTVLYFTDMGVKGLLISIIISTTVFVLLELYLYIKLSKIKFLISKEILNRVFKYGIPLIGVSVAGLILSVADRYMIQYYLGEKAVGIYSAGYRIAEIGIQNIFKILMLAAFPVIIKKYVKHGEKSAANMIKKFLDYYFLILIPAVFGIWALSKDIVNVLLGDQFAEAYTLLPWVAVGVFALGLTQYVNKPFELKERTKGLFFLLLFSCITNIVLNIYFIPCFGIIGAAYSTLVSYSSYLLISSIISSNFFSLKISFTTFFKSLLSSVIMFFLIRGLILFDLEYNIILIFIKVILGIIVYSISLIILREKNIIKLISKERIT